MTTQLDEGLAMARFAYYGITTAEDEMEAERMSDTLTISIENLAHFQCPHCKGWWSVGDAPKREYWFCPWCGEKCVVSEGKQEEPVVISGTGRITEIIERPDLIIGGDIG